MKLRGSTLGVQRRKDARFPLAEILSEIFPTAKPKNSVRPTTKGGTEKQDPVATRLKRDARIEVVSEQLCDDVIKYLAPTLEPYKGCTLLDIHPGACLWSSKLHDFLKPKRHILMEPEERYVKPFIQPLLDKPGSTYRHTYLTGAHPSSYWDSYSKIMADPNMMEPRPLLPDGDPRLRQRDTSMLVTGNLWRRYPERVVRTNVETVHLLVRQMAGASISNHIFQRSGLVRMLWWMPDLFKTEILANNIRARSHYNAALDTGVHITEVAGAVALENYDQAQKAETPRAPTFDIAAAERTRRRTTEEAGLRLPEDRDVLKLDMEVKDAELKNLVNNNPLETHCKTIEDLEKATKDLENHTASISGIFNELTTAAAKLPATNRSAYGKAATSTLKTKADESIRYPQTHDLINRRKSSKHLMASVNMRCRAVLSLDLELRLINLEANYAAVRDHTPPDSPELEAFRTRIIAHGDAIHELVRHDILHEVNHDATSMIRDDLRAFYATPPTLTRDRRAYSPLLIHPHEFWPQTPMCLLDLTPATRPLALEGINTQAEGAKVVSELLKHLFIGQKNSIVYQLNRVAPNAGNDLPGLVPAITDARKGGRLDPAKVVVRMLTDEMLEGLAKAFLEWPFRPPMWQLELASEKVAEGRASEGEGEGIEEEED